MQTPILPTFEMETSPTPEYAVIWLHGLGADGYDFEAVVPELGLAGAAGVRFVFPHAQSMPVTCNGGIVMPAWYDIVSLAPDSRRIDEAGLLHARELVRALIARENRRGIASERVFLAGFSQGGAVAITTALTHAERLAGLIALSTYLPLPQRVCDEATAVNRELPVFAAHGSEDDVVAPALGRAARDFLSGGGWPVQWQEYPMAHAVCIEEVEALGAWLRARIAATPAR